jgi:hypothetical protein
LEAQRPEIEGGLDIESDNIDGAQFLTDGVEGR